MKIEFPISSDENVIYPNELKDSHLIIAYKNNKPYAVMIQDASFNYIFVNATAFDSVVTDEHSSIIECIEDLRELDSDMTFEAYE